MRTYQHPTEARSFYSPDREPLMDLPFKLWHVSGLDNYSIPKPLLVKKNDYAAAHGIQPEQVVSHATTGSGPSASFLGSDMRAAYYGGTALTGAGQNVGLLEFVGTDLADLQTYYKNVGQTYPTGVVTLLSTDGTSTSCTHTRPSRCDDTEQTLDMTQALGMAPGLASLTVYVGSSDTAMISAMTTHSPLPTTIGCSWGWTPADPSTLDPFFQKMAAQGQNFFAASGDSSTWSSSNEAWPADDAFVVSVGGTDLVTSSAAGPWASETAWVDSGGGISPDGIKIPSWQTAAINSGNKGSTTLRNGPDVSANANFTFYVCADQTTCTANSYGGTSFAAPMWAGYIALVNQQLASVGKGPIGFINPTIYAQNANASTYAADFHDIKSGTSGSFSAVTGFDLVTGWGSPNTGLIDALTGGGTQQGTFSLSGTGATVTQGSNGTSTITVTVNGTLSSGVTLSASGLPSGVTPAFGTNPVNGSGTSVLTFTATSTATTGTFSITVTGTTSDGTTETTPVSLTVNPVSTSGDFTIVASPTALPISRGGSSTVAINTTAIGTPGTVSLTVSGLAKGVTATLSKPSVTAGAGATLTLKVAHSASTGSSTILVTGTEGSNSHQASVTLTVN
jgi:subtilase family serine protease